MAHSGILAGGAQGQDAVGALCDLPLQQLRQDLKIDAAILVERGDHGHDGTLDVFELHVVCPPYFLSRIGSLSLQGLAAFLPDQNKKSVEARSYRQYMHARWRQAL